MMMMMRGRKPGRKKSQDVASGNRADMKTKTDLPDQESIVDVLNSLETWEEAANAWIQIADSICKLKDDEKRSEKCLQRTEIILLAAMKIKVNDEFSITPRNMIRLFEAWDKVYNDVIQACSKNSDQCCTFAIKLANKINEMIGCIKMDCRLVFVYSQIIRTQIENFDYDLISEIFIGDFDVSGKGNVLDSFCKLLVEIHKHLLTMLDKHSDKRTGIVAELLSKSLLNILEATTILICGIKKPVHIVFVVGALGKFIGKCIALVTKKGCRMLSKSQTNVTSLVKTVVTALTKHYSGPYGTSLLSHLEPVLINGLRWSRLRQSLIIFWQETFGHSSNLVLSNELKVALEHARCTSMSFAAKQKSSSDAGSSTISTTCDTNFDVSLDENCSSSSKKGIEQPTPKETKPVTLKPRICKYVEDDSLEEYAIIVSSPSAKKMRLTEHQKEKLMERRDSLQFLNEDSNSVDFAARIPPGYTDSSLSVDSQRSITFPKIESMGKKSDQEDGGVIASSSIKNDTEAKPKNQDPPIKSNDKNDNICDAISGDKVGKDATENCVVPKEGSQDVQAENLSKSCEDSFDDEHKKNDSDETNVDAKVILPEVQQTTEHVEQQVLDKSKFPTSCETPAKNDGEPPKTPNSILKKCGKTATCSTSEFSSLNGKKYERRVHFDASTLDDDDIYGSPRRKTFRRSKKSLFPGIRLNNRLRPKSPSKPQPPVPLNKDPAKALFPLFVGSVEPIPAWIFIKLAPTMGCFTLQSLLKSRGVLTVGDLACISEQDIETLPFRDPKLSRFKEIMEDHFKRKRSLSKEVAMKPDKCPEQNQQNTSAECGKEVRLETKLFNPSERNGSTSFSKPVHERDTAEIAPKASGKLAHEASAHGACTNKHLVANEASTEHVHTNLFHSEPKRFVPIPDKRLSSSETTADGSTYGKRRNLESIRIAPFSETKQRSAIQMKDSDRSRFGYRCPFVRSEKPKIDEDAKKMTESEKKAGGNSSANSSVLSEEKMFATKSPDENVDRSEVKLRTERNLVPERGNSGKCNASASLKNAFRTLLQNPVVAAIAGDFSSYDVSSSGTIERFSNEQLLSFSQACAIFQLTVIRSATRMVKEID